MVLETLVRGAKHTYKTIIHSEYMLEGLNRWNLTT